MDNNGLYRDYTGPQILEIDEQLYDPIIDSLIFKNDMVIIVGKQKSNKSILSMQIACAVTSGQPFLNTFQTTKPGVVWYFATEGKDGETKDRFLRMSKKVDCDFENLVLICSTQMKFNTDAGKNAAKDLILKYKDKLPALIIIDSLFSSFKGKLKEDDQVNEYLSVVRYIMEYCGDSAVILTHHMTKEQKDYKGNTIRQSDQNAYGSVFLLGQADSVLTIERCNKKKEDRVIKCETQRSGKVIEELRVQLHEPEPLFLSLISKHKEEEHIILRLLFNYTDGMTAAEIMDKSDIKKSLAYIVLGELTRKERIVKLSGHGGIYKMKKAS